jgi:hypothetical protein
VSIGTELRNPVLVRFADPAKEPVVAWLKANAERNAFDPEVLDYPSTSILAAHNNGTVYAYMPIQSVVMLESIGPNPEESPIHIAEGVMNCVRGAALTAYSAGCREIYFLANDEVTAEGAKKMGFEQCPFKVFRKKLT